MAVALFVALVPILLISVNVRLVINWPSLYSRGFDKHEQVITRYIDIERDEYLLAGEQIRDYFNGDEERIDVRVVAGGVRASIFTEREVLHMSDVRGLVRGVYRIGEVAALYILAFTVIGLVYSRRRLIPRLGRYLSGGGLLTLALVLGLGLGALVGFDRLFLAFHLVSFSNDLWQLDPRQHNLIALYPQGFFFDATMLIALLTILEAVALAAVPVAIRMWLARAARGRADSRYAAASEGVSQT